VLCFNRGPGHDGMSPLFPSTSRVDTMPMNPYNIVMYEGSDSLRPHQLCYHGRMTPKRAVLEVRIPLSMSLNCNHPPDRF
jgi:hypothetical protein